MRARRALTAAGRAALAAAILALLPNTAQTTASHPDPQPITGRQIIHDPTVIRTPKPGLNQLRRTANGWPIAL
ncbi:hypothetical protein [Streptomyces sp. NPDC059010]|uniref:hypothetical protein n=1 Tax=Streptomyces sp. NPDC059010 TaxID=3346695 RepID=UPI003678BA36